MESRECNLLGYIQKDVIDFHTNLSVQYLFYLAVFGSKLAREIHNIINLSVNFQFITNIFTLTSRSDASITYSLASRNSEEL